MCRITLNESRAAAFGESAPNYALVLDGVNASYVPVDCARDAHPTLPRQSDVDISILDALREASAAAAPKPAAAAEAAALPSPVGAATAPAPAASAAAAAGQSQHIEEALLLGPMPTDIGELSAEQLASMVACAADILAGAGEMSRKVQDIMGSHDLPLVKYAKEKLKAMRKRSAAILDLAQQIAALQAAGRPAPAAAMAPLVSQIVHCRNHLFGLFRHVNHSHRTWLANHGNAAAFAHDPAVRPDELAAALGAAAPIGHAAAPHGALPHSASALALAVAAAGLPPLDFLGGACDRALSPCGPHAGAGRPCSGSVPMPLPSGWTPWAGASSNGSSESWSSPRSGSPSGSPTHAASRRNSNDLDAAMAPARQQPAAAAGIAPAAQQRCISAEQELAQQPVSLQSLTWASLYSAVQSAAAAAQQPQPAAPASYGAPSDVLIDGIDIAALLRELGLQQPVAAAGWQLAPIAAQAQQRSYAPLGGCGAATAFPAAAQQRPAAPLDPEMSAWGRAPAPVELDMWPAWQQQQQQLLLCDRQAAAAAAHHAAAAAHHAAAAQLLFAAQGEAMMQQAVPEVMARPAAHASVAAARLAAGWGAANW